ncbi:phage late control D family protein [Shewanella sp.]|uniref:phage late control D family protein n=1 Tax=Shewanella sp. TaxID=50422 RepID=UPI003A976EC6
MQPDYRITVDGNDISSKIKPRLISLSLDDKRGFESDSLELQLDDSDGQLNLPRKGAAMSVKLGWKNAPLVDKGSYIIDEVSHSGPPDVLTIRGKSVNLRGSLQKLREQSWHGQTLQEIVNIIASRHQLTAKLSDTLAGQLIDHLDQANESDASFLTRMAQQFDAIATVKADNLLFMLAGQALSATGKALPATTITRSSGDRHSFNVADRESYSGVIAYWQDNKSAKRTSVSSDGKQKEDKQVLLGDDDNVKILRHTYASKENAQRAAKAEWQRLQRGKAKLQLTLAQGNPALFPECPVTVSGFKTEIDQLAWLLVNVRHEIRDSGYTSQLEFEVKQ